MTNTTEKKAAPVKLSSLKSKPVLIEKMLNDPEVIEAYGGPVQFWTLDRLPLETYMQIVSADAEDIRLRFTIARTLILNEDGTQMLSGEEVFTPSLMTAVVSEVFSDLGNF